MAKQNLECQSPFVLWFTGLSGSGKSTTLAAMIDYINSSKREHILTIEDPIEFVHKNKLCLISQREVHRDTHSFNNALRSALREDPDIILVGELRDLETIRLAISAAETGLSGLAAWQDAMRLSRNVYQRIFCHSNCTSISFCL